MQLTSLSSSRGVFPSDLHSYTKRRFISPFAPPCSLLGFLLHSGLVEGSRGEAGGSWGKVVGLLIGRVAKKFFNNSIVSAVVVVVVVVVV